MALERSERSGLRQALGSTAIAIGVVVGLTVALLLVLFVIWVSGRTEQWYRYVAGLQGVPPLVAALFAGRRIAVHWDQIEATGERRYAVGLAVFALGLLSWAGSEFGLLGQGFVAVALPLYPGWLDVGPIAAILCWTVAIFITLEGHVDEHGQRFDVMRAINVDAAMLTVLLGANVALIAIFHGADFQIVLSSNGGALAVGYALDILYTTADLFLAWMTISLVHGMPGRTMIRGRSALVLMACGLTILYLADLIFTLNYAVGQREGEFLFSRYYGIIPDFVYIAAIACLAVAAQLYPLAPPVFAADIQ
ncbi:MAG TPA: hypothetical protein VFQ80_07560 [Thermomicrobiales bacterium]|nr:hypothetical protein [Thermomicrobiales bacterium]